MTAIAADSRVAAFEAVEAALADRQPLSALQHLAALHAADPADARVYHGAFRALAALAGDPDATVPAEHDGVWTLLRAMILQDACSERPRILHHSIASLLTSQNARTARQVMALLWPGLDGLMAEAPEAPGVVLLLAVARAVMPAQGPSSERITQLHLAVFTAFSASDLSLPYSVKFSPELFGANVADLFGRYRDAPASLDPAAGLGLRHLRILDQLGLGPLFAPGQDQALADAVATRLARSPDDPDEQAAARALVMRYLRATDGPAVDRLRGAGLSAQLLSAAAGWPRASRGTGRRVPSLGGSATRYLAAGLNAARIAAPWLALPGRRARVALCVSGQLRGYERAFATWKRALLPFADFDVYVHTWARVGRSDPQPFRAFLPFEGAAFCAAWRRVGTLEGFDRMKARHPRLFAALDAGNVVDEPGLQAVYGAQAVVVEDDTAPRFADFSNQDRMHYKIHAADALSRESGRSYDLTMRLRPDLALRLPGFSWGTLRRACAQSPVIFADGGFGMHYGSLMIGDQLAIGAPETMARYAATWSVHEDLARFAPAGVPAGLTGHVSLAQVCWYSDIAVRSLPFRRAGLLDVKPLSSADVLRVLERDADGRNDAMDCELIAAVRQDLGA